jgi:plastocyanin
MRRVFIFLFVLLVPISAIAHSGKNIHIDEFGFTPTVIEIAQGQTVTFENVGTEPSWPASNDHPTHQIYSEFDPKEPVKPGEVWIFTFDKPGDWKFHDHLSPQHTGIIKVKQKQTTIQKIFSEMKGFITGFFSSEQEDSDFSTNFTSPPANSNTITYDQSCDSHDFDCVEELLRNITTSYGPQHALETLHKMQEEKKVSPALDDHEFAHQIGRTTANTFGINPDAFFLCDTDFDYGCQHGFFEYALGKTNTTTQAVALICDVINESYPVHFKYRCYHGAGHGIMMSRAYDLNATLQVCDQLQTDLAKDGCWQGALMENTNAIMKQQAREEYYSNTDPLIPCTQLQEKYRYECFYNQAPWIMKFNNYDVRNASLSCLKAPPEHVPICERGLALTLASPKWHALVLKNWEEDKFVENTWAVCQQFQKNHTLNCVLGSIDNILNFDEIKITRATDLCTISDIQYQQECFTEIGRNLAYRTTENSAIINACNDLKDDFRNVCLKGANMVRPVE